MIRIWGKFRRYGLANAGQTIGFFEGHNQKIGAHYFHRLRHFYFLLDFTYDLDVGLIGNRSHYEFPNQPWPVCQ